MSPSFNYLFSPICFLVPSPNPPLSLTNLFPTTAWLPSALLLLPLQPPVSSISPHHGVPSNYTSQPTSTTSCSRNLSSLQCSLPLHFLISQWSLLLHSLSLPYTLPPSNSLTLLHFIFFLPSLPSLPGNATFHLQPLFPWTSHHLR